MTDARSDRLMLAEPTGIGATATLTVRTAPLSFGLDQPQHLPWRIIRHAAGSAQIIDASGATRITECAMPVASFIVTCVNANDKLVAECCRQAEALMDLHALVVKEQPSKERDARLDAVTRGMFGDGTI